VRSLLFSGKRSEELVFLFHSLEFTVAEFRAGIDEFNLDGLGGSSVGLSEETLLRVMALFFTPTIPPLTIKKSLLTTP